MTEPDRLLVPAERLRHEHDPAGFAFECTEDLVPLTEFIGQDRALRALAFGLGVDKAGYNIFVTGLTGTGKATALLEYIRRAVQEKQQAGALNQPDDWCYVYNFDEPDRPLAIQLPAGTGRQLQRHLEELLSSARTNLALVFTSDQYDRMRRAIIERGQAEGQPLMDAAQKQAEQAGFVLSFWQGGVNLVPMVQGRPMKPEEYAALSPDARREIALFFDESDLHTYQRDVDRWVFEDPA